MEKNKIITKESLEMDMQTYKKVKGTLDPKEKIKITGDKPAPSTLNSVTEDIEPQDATTIKYLSNVKDSKTGEISRPFNLGGKKYQMVRGLDSSNKIVMGVYCYDETDKSGENIIHPLEYFEQNIANKHRSTTSEFEPKPELDEADTELVEPKKETDFKNKEDFMDFLNLRDVQGFKHFFVNIKTGDVTGKFKSTKEIATSGSKLGPDEDYMDINSLKKFRFGKYFKSDINEEETSDTGGTDVNKLQSDVKKLTGMIKNKFSAYLAKLDKPIEQAQFLTAMANEIGVPLNKLSTIVNTYKDLATQTKPLAESRIFTKNQLETGKIIKSFKISDVNNE